MSISAGGRVDFDFEGSLQLARKLWQLADDLVTEDDGRGTEAETALAKWEGPYSTQFGERRTSERESRTNVVSGLRADARSWASAWVEAMHQQNKNNRAAKVEQIRDDRGWLEKGWDNTFGEDDSDDQVGEADRPSTPQPPEFTATAEEQVF